MTHYQIWNAYSRNLEPSPRPVVDGTACRRLQNLSVSVQRIFYQDCVLGGPASTSFGLRPLEERAEEGVDPRVLEHRDGPQRDETSKFCSEMMGVLWIWVQDGDALKTGIRAGRA